jgi:hypothetical protein
MFSRYKRKHSLADIDFHNECRLLLGSLTIWEIDLQGGTFFYPGDGVSSAQGEMQRDNMYRLLLIFFIKGINS